MKFAITYKSIRCCFMLLTLATVNLTRPAVAADGELEGNGAALTLDEAVALALNSNPMLQAATHAAEAAQLRVRKTRADLFPKADVEFRYARLDPGSVRRGNVFVEPGRALVESFGSGDPNDVRPTAYGNNFSTAFQIIQPIYNGGGTWASVSAARAEADGEERREEDSKQQVILDVKVSYLHVLQAKELVALAQKNVDAATGHLKKSQRMLDVGMRDRTEVLRWEVQRAGHEGNLVEAENSLKVAMAALRQAMGVPQQKAFDTTPLALEPEPLSESYDDQITRTLTQHPGLRALRASLNAGHAGVRLASAALQPRINFLYQLSWEENNTPALDSFSSWSAGISFRMPIFHSLKNITGIQEAKVEVRRLQETQRQAEAAVTLQLISARSDVESALKRFHIAGKALEQADENLRILNNTYSLGLATNLDVLDAEVARTKSNTDLIAARYDYWIARAQLERVTGASNN